MSILNVPNLAFKAYRTLTKLINNQYFHDVCIIINQLLSIPSVSCCLRLSTGSFSLVLIDKVKCTHICSVLIFGGEVLKENLYFLQAEACFVSLFLYIRLKYVELILVLFEIIYFILNQIMKFSCLETLNLSNILPLLHLLKTHRGQVKKYT